MLILASSSPRRVELLRNAGIEVVVCPAGIPEAVLPGESPTDTVRRLARDKARSVWNSNQEPAKEHELFVLAADTEVVVDGQVLGKPRDAADAARMLRLLSGRTHQVTTGVCLLGTENRKLGTGFEDLRSEITQVTMDTLTEEDISSYVAHGEPMGKAGAYAVQGIASRWVSRLEGCYFNVVGLPVPLVYRMLREHGAV